MTDGEIESGSKPKYEARWKRIDRTHTRGNPVIEKVKVRIDPANPENVPVDNPLLPQKPPEVIQEEKKEAQIEGWRNRTNI